MRHEYASQGFERTPLRGARAKAYDRHHGRRQEFCATPTRKQARKSGPVKLVLLKSSAAVPATVMMPVVMPTDFSRRTLRSFLDRSSAGRIGQRQRLGLLSRSGKDQYRTNCSEA